MKMNLPKETKEPLSKSIANLRVSAAEMRMDCLKMALASGNEGAHLGGAFSCIEILASLFLSVMRYSPNDLNDPERDRFIFSKGHGVQAQYAVYKQLGLIAEEELFTFKKSGTFLTGHPSKNSERGIEFSTGSLGQGLSLGVGSGLALRQQRNCTSRVFVLMGDGECDEGQVWEAAQCAAHYKLDSIVAIIDRNNLQYDGDTEEVLSLGSLTKKWEAFGWDVSEVNGHDFSQLIPALSTKIPQKPRAIVANTVKGRGLSFTENVAAWHHGRLTEELYQRGMAEIAAELNTIEKSR